MTDGLLSMIVFLISRYMLMYQQNSSSIDTTIDPGFTESTLSMEEMLGSLGTEDHTVYGHTGSQHSQYKHLSSDLMGIELKPLHKDKQGEDLLTKQ